MKERSKQIAACGMMSALSIVLMLLGAVLELGIYAAPMLAGLLLEPLGEKWGRRTQALVWIAVSILSLLLVPNVEESLLFLGLFGWYPVVRPALQRLPRLLRIAVKLLVFNAAMIAVEALVMLVLVPQTIGTGLLLTLLFLGNLMFLLYDMVIPRVGMILGRIAKKRH